MAASSLSLDQDSAPEAEEADRIENIDSPHLPNLPGIISLLSPEEDRSTRLCLSSPDIWFPARLTVNGPICPFRFVRVGDPLPETAYFQVHLVFFNFQQQVTATYVPGFNLEKLDL